MFNEQQLKILWLYGQGKSYKEIEQTLNLKIPHECLRRLIRAFIMDAIRSQSEMLRRVLNEETN